MKKSESLHRTLAVAATLAALGASVGVPAGQVLAASPTGKYGAVQDKMARLHGTGAVQSKIEASQVKIDKARRSAINRPGRNRMLNPQPLPPKGRSGTPGGLLPAVKQ
jgi:hypothetical protein